MVLQLPNPHDWLTRGAAARILGVDAATVGRMVGDGRLRGYSPDGIRGERPPVIFWRPEVEALHEARRTAREGVQS